MFIFNSKLHIVQTATKGCGLNLYHHNLHHNAVIVDADRVQKFCDFHFFYLSDKGGALQVF